MRKVLTVGTFDPFHAGHADLLNECRRHGDHLIVGVLGDRFVRIAKGAHPTFPEDQRLEWARVLADEAYIEYGRWQEPGRVIHPDRILEGDIDVVVVGGDWHTRDYHERLGLSQGQLDALEVTVVYVPRRLNVSATGIKETVQE